MKYISLLFLLLIVSCTSMKPDEKLYVVERERESLYVLENKKESIISDLGNLNHATVKFRDNFAIVLGRDGYVSKINVKENKLIKKVKIGKSGIGITFIKNYIAIVNYDPNSVVILDTELNVLKTIETKSRNVGVKAFNNYLVFSTMDTKEIWVLDSDNDFSIVSKFTNIGDLPFDALIKEDKYVVGFFNEAAVGIVDLSKLEYKKIILKDKNSNLVYKVPHFGYWGVFENKAIVPISAEKKLLVLDLETLSPIEEIKLNGNPVFASLSLKRRELAVNFSGDEEDKITLVDIDNYKVKKEIIVGKRVMHLRYSLDSRKLYATTYFDNFLNVFNTENWEREERYIVATPSGIFLPEMRE